MGFSQWVKAVATNDDTYITYNNLVKKTAAEVDTIVNTYNHSFGNSNTVKINTNGLKEAGVQFIFEGLEVGDIIEVEAEARVISGASPLIKTAEYNSTTLVEGYPQKKMSDLNSEWQMIKLKSFVGFPTTQSGFRAFVGLEAGQVGVFELRSVRAIAYTKAIQPQDKIDRGFYRYIIKKVAGVWTMQSGSSEGSINLLQAWSLELTFPAQAYVSIQANTNLYDFPVGFTPPSATKTVLNIAGNSWTAVADGTFLYVTVFYKY